MTRQNPNRRRQIITLLAVWVACANGHIVFAAEPSGSQTLRLALDDLEKHLTQNEWTETLPPAQSFGVTRITAFEDHAYFIYVAGAIWSSKPLSAHTREIDEPEILRRVVFIRPGTIVIDDQVAAHGTSEVSWSIIAPELLAPDDQDLVAAGQHANYRIRSVLPATAKWRFDRSQHHGSATHVVPLPQNTKGERTRILHLLSFSNDHEAALPLYSLEPDVHGLRLELIEQSGPRATGRTIRLWLPNSPTGGKLQITHRDGSELLAKRLLPGGVLPPGLEAAQRRLQWNLPYRIEGLATWDARQPSSELRRRVESGQIKPCRTLEVGCGTGNDAIYLAGRGFDVTAIDISPAALAIAEKKASEAGVKVHWLLADILQPPLLNSFDFVYDRGCYHELRRQHAEDYVAAIRELTHHGSRILILAASANKDSYWRFDGPPRVREEDIGKDFASGFRLLELREFRFDPPPSERQGPLAWSILLERVNSDSKTDGDSAQQ